MVPGRGPNRINHRLPTFTISYSNTYKTTQLEPNYYYKIMQL